MGMMRLGFVWAFWMLLTGCSVGAHSRFSVDDQDAQHLLNASSSRLEAAAATRLVFLRGSELWLCDSWGRDQRKLAYIEELGEGNPALSPNGSLVAVAVGFDDQMGLSRIRVFPLDGGAPREVAMEGIHGATGPCFTADGLGLLAVTASRLAHGPNDSLIADMAVTRWDLDSGQWQHVVVSSGVFVDAGRQYAAPACSRDGRLVAIQESGSDVSGGFFVLDAEDRQIWRYPVQADDYHPYWRPQFSSDGRRILCFSPSTDEESADSIYLVEMDSGTRQIVTKGANAVFVDAGTTIVFERAGECAEGEMTDLWRLDLRADAVPQRIVRDARNPASSVMRDYTRQWGGLD